MVEGVGWRSASAWGDGGGTVAGTLGNRNLFNEHRWSAEPWTLNDYQVKQAAKTARPNHEDAPNIRQLSL